MSVYVSNSANRAAAVTAFIEGAKTLEGSAGNGLAQEYIRQLQELDSSQVNEFNTALDTVISADAKAIIAPLRSQSDSYVAKSPRPALIEVSQANQARVYAFVRGVFSGGPAGDNSARAEAAICSFMRTLNLPLSQAILNATIGAALSPENQ